MTVNGISYDFLFHMIFYTEKSTGKKLNNYSYFWIQDQWKTRISIHKKAKIKKCNKNEKTQFAIIIESGDAPGS